MILGPPARWIAPSTPPPPANWLLAALTMASVVWRVISPVTSSSTHGPIDTCICSPSCAIIPASDRLLHSLKQWRTGSLDCSTMYLAAQAQQTVGHTEDGHLHTWLLFNALLYSRMRYNPLGEGGPLNWPPS